jgi:hypothetical protein
LLSLVQRAHHIHANLKEREEENLTKIGETRIAGVDLREEIAKT